jgi:hypothetical protein
VREAIAAAIERGEPLKPVRLRAQALEDTQPNKVRERGQSPTR